MSFSISKSMLRAAAVVSLLSPGITHGASTETLFVLSFDSLPSAQGFTYGAVGNSLAESDIFSVDGTTLFQNSLSAPLVGSGENLYTMPNPLDPSAEGFTLEVRARVLEELNSSPHNHNGLGFGFPSANNVGVGDHAVKLILPDPTPEGAVIQDSVLLDTSMFHDFRLETDYASASYQFFVDGALRAEGPIDLPFMFAFDLYLGDASGGSNAQAEITRFVLSQRFPAIAVAIDVKPGSSPNCFNIDDNGVIPIAILGTADFDVNEVDVDTLLFDGLQVRVRGKRGPLCSTEYSNDDEFLDLVCQFEDDADMWQGGEAEGKLTGFLLDGMDIEGTDSICIVP